MKEQQWTEKLWGVSFRRNSKIKTTETNSLYELAF